MKWNAQARNHNRFFFSRLRHSIARHISEWRNPILKKCKMRGMMRISLYYRLFLCQVSHFNWYLSFVIHLFSDFTVFFIYFIQCSIQFERIDVRSEMSIVDNHYEKIKILILIFQDLSNKWDLNYSIYAEIFGLLR